MKIVDLKCSPMSEMPDCEPNPYPFGLKISLDEGVMKKLGIEAMPELGDKVAFYVCGSVVSTSESNEFGEHKCMGVQIECMAIEEPPEVELEEAKDAIKGGFKGAASTLYPKQKG